MYAYNPYTNANKKVGDYSFNPMKILGSGSYSTVYLGQNDVTGKQVAIKVIEIKSLTDSYMLTTLQSEIEILKNLNHVNIVRIYEVLTTSNNIYIITEYCNGGTLDQFLKQQQRLPEETAIKVMKDIFRGFKELLKNSIVHRDIKPANIFINEGVFKIGDFGFAKKLENIDENLMNSIVGTPLYMSPQCLENQWYSSKNDVYSLGIIFFKLLYGRTPWPSRTRVDLIQNMSRSPLVIPDVKEVSQESKMFLMRSLQYSEKERIEWDEIFNCNLFVEQEEKKETIVNENALTDNQNIINLENKNQEQNGKDNSEKIRVESKRNDDSIKINFNFILKTETLACLLEEKKKNINLNDLLNFKLLFLIRKCVGVVAKEIKSLFAINKCEDENFKKMENDINEIQSINENKLKNLFENNDYKEQIQLNDNAFNVSSLNLDNEFNQNIFPNILNYLKLAIRECNHNLFHQISEKTIDENESHQIKLLNQMVDFYQITLLFVNYFEPKMSQIYEKISVSLKRYLKVEELSKFDYTNYIDLRKKIYEISI